MTSIGQFSARKALTRALVTVLVIGGALPVAAQQGDSRNVILSDDGQTPSYTLGKKTGFSLFGLGDLGVTGMRMSGEFGFGVTTYGPCSDGFTVHQCGDVLKDGIFRFSIFEINIVAGTPPTDYAKIRAAYPAGAVAGGGGWSTLQNGLLFAQRVEIGPADGGAGRLFSGVTSTDDGSCRDHSSPLGGYTSTGFSLLAGSDCPETWAGAFDGPRLYADTAYTAAFTADPANFRFDYWRVPAATKAASEFAGDFSTYGTMSDSYQEIIESYGTVTKLGADRGLGAPKIPGYPLGLDFRFEAFQFGTASIRNAVFYQLLVVNNSAKVYGAGVNYDSLYIGLTPGWGRRQSSTLYYVPSRNALLTTEIGASGTSNCNGAVDPGALPCATTGFGFSRGATGIVILKSPIGDARNKLFTRPGLFNAPANVNRGDTITFNHGHLCGFGSCWDQTWAVNDRRAFSLMSSTGSNYLEGRDVNALTATQFYRVFRNVDFPTRTPKFNAYVPGNWDYNKDGVQDTLFFDSCHTLGCVKTWSDTMPGTTRYTNRGSNVGGVMTAGPIKLRAGDTTSFIFAFVGAPDSAGMEAVVDNVNTVYLQFFLVPKPPPAPKVLRVATVQGDSSVGPSVSITYSTEALRQPDKFLLAFANNVATGPDSSQRILRTLNPTLAADITARANANLAQILVFKSCDGGNTFTADADCDGDPLVDQSGKSIGLGWRPYAVITPAQAAALPVFVDANVIGGRTYLYSFVSKGKGFRAVVRDSVAGREVARELLAVDTTLTSLQRSGPTVAKVYVPISRAAGSVAGNAIVSTVAGRGTVPITVSVDRSAAAGTYQLVFGNRFIITDTLNNTTKVRKTVVAVQTIVPQARSGTSAPVANFVRSQSMFTDPAAPGPLPVSGTVTTTTTTSGVNTITVRTVTATGFALVKAGATPASGIPLFVSTTLTANQATPTSFFGASNFPGFTIDLNQSGGELLVLERIVEPDGDTVVTGIQNGTGTALQYVERRSTKRSTTSGQYEFVFDEDAFGPLAPFRLRGVDSTEAEVLRSLGLRPMKSTADTTAALRAVVGAAVPGFASRSFVAARLPFAVSNTTFGRPATVLVPRRAAAANTIRLGTGADTLSITVPDSIWLPGDTIFLVETIQRDSLKGDTLQLDGTGQPIRVTSPAVTLGPVVLDCNTAANPRLACNPLVLGTPGATGYYDYAAGTKLVVRYQTLFAPGDTINVVVSPSVEQPTQMTRGNVKGVRVVPNPFVVLSAFDQVNNSRVGDPRLYFTGVPASGSLRVYSVSGQFLQEITWTPADLNGSGDLPYNLRTREGTDIATGLYIFVLKGVGTDGKTATGRGKFVVIR